MAGHTIPIIKYFRLKKINNKRSNRNRVKILKETLISDGIVEIKVKVISKNEEENKFLIRFNDRPMHSTIHKIKDEAFRN